MKQKQLKGWLYLLPAIVFLGSIAILELLLVPVQSFLFVKQSVYGLYESVQWS